MAALNVLRQVKIDGKWLRLPVAQSCGSRDFTRVLHHGKPVVALEGTFYLEYRGEDGRKVRRAVGTHPREAKAALATQASVLGLRAQGVSVDDAPQIRARSEAESGGKTVRDIVADFVKSPPLKLRSRSVAKYRDAMRAFGAWCRKVYVSEVDRDDLKGFMSHLVLERKLEVSTAVDKAIIVLSVLREHGGTLAMRKGDWPRVTERDVEVYTPEVLKPLFAAAEPFDFALFQAFLLTGMRDQEVGFLAWPDFNPKRGTLKVSKKLELGFDPKNYQERTVPIPDVLVKILEAHRRRQQPGELLIFPTSRSNSKKGLPGGQRDRHMLNRLKRLAKAAGLNCGRCTGTVVRKPTTCAKAPICQNFGLHKFRHTYATTLLRDGVDLISLQKLLGHKDLDSTRKYLRALEPDDLLLKINQTSLATRFV